ncbi:MAG: hypothetical protein CL949_07210 [Erythrobacter sp.]|nr:hypothetical protein [Erythrobacter sp.]|tara:strand:+ start:191 stop:571 length:381 start_codon:yes stop_codon:yes gene_type:complete
MKLLIIAAAAAIAVAPFSVQAATIEEWQETSRKATGLLEALIEIDGPDIPEKVCPLSRSLHEQSNAMRDDLIALIADGLTIMEERKPISEDEPFSKIGKLMVIKADHDVATGIAVRLCVEYTKLNS